jgi:hypothetical protein
MDEPVSWAVQEGANLHDVFLFKDEADEMCHLKGTHAKAVPLYREPPTPTKLITVGNVLEQAGYVKKKEWVGLTDEEIHEIRLKTLDSVATNYEVYRAIEAKLKEKNNGNG